MAKLKEEMLRECEARVKRNISFDRDKWIQAISVKSVTNSYLKEMILNYLVSEGYENAASTFASESGLDLGERNSELIKVKDRVRMALKVKDVSQVITALNEFNSELLLNNPELGLRLHLVTFCDLVQKEKFDDALEFIREKAEPFLEAGQYVDLIDEHMMLLVCKDIAKSPSAHLLSESRLLDLNTRINKELNERMDAELIVLMKLTKWMETRLNQKHKVPQLTNFAKLQFSLK